MTLEYKGEPKLDELVDTYRNRNKGEKYDCVVAVSGGRDSTSKKFSPAMVPALCLGCRYFYLISVGFTERDELLRNMIRERWQSYDFSA